MTWAILIVFLIIIGLMTLTAREQVPWVHYLRRIHAGVADYAEWMAPEQVQRAVHDDYLKAITWLQESGLDDWTEQWRVAPIYLSGMYLSRYQEILKSYKTGRLPRFVGVLRCSHRVEIRHFSEDGERCLVVDRQSDCRMATYDNETQQRINTQDLGESAVVYEMSYDKQLRRWKIDDFIQELPHSSSRTNKPAVRLLSGVPPKIGRDN